MKPIPAPRIGESHGLLRAISQRDRVRLDEFLTEFSAEDLFPPGLENAHGRTRQFVSYARAAGLAKEDRGTVELTEIGKRYVRAGDEADPFSVSDAQADWLRRQLLEKHMTDSIYHGLAIGLSLLSSVAPGTRVAMLDFGRALGYLGRAGWDNDNTLQSQGERYLALLRDLSLIDDERSLTRTGHEVKAELTLPVHMSLSDIAGQQNPGGPEAVRAAGEQEWAQLSAAGAPVPEAAAQAAPAAAAPAAVAPAPAGQDDEDEWQDVGPGAARPAADPFAEPPPPPPAPTAAPEPAAAAPPPAAPAEAAAAPAPAPEPAPAPAAEEWQTVGGITSGDPLGAGAEARPQDAPTVISQHEQPAAPRIAEAPPAAVAPAAEAPAQVPRLAEAPPASPRQASGFLDAAAIRSSAERQGLRLPTGVYANAAAALATGRHLVLTGAPGSGKTSLALAIASAAAGSGRSSGAMLVTASDRWSARDTLGRPPREPGDPARLGHVVGAATRGKWLVIDELDRAPLDRAFGALSSFLAGLPVTLPGGGESTPPEGWRIVATAGGAAGDASAALMRRFAFVHLPSLDDGTLDALIAAAAGGDGAAADAARRLLPLREVRGLGAGVFVDAARHAAERNAIEPADQRTLARELYSGYVERLMGGLDDRRQVRLRELLGAL